MMAISSQVHLILIPGLRLFFNLLSLYSLHCMNNFICRFLRSDLLITITRLFILLFLLKNSLPLSAQSADSLETLLKKAKGPERINLQLQLADMYDSKDWEKSAEYARQALALANEYHQDSLRFEANFILSKSYHGLGDDENALIHGKETLTLAFDIPGRAAAIHHLGRIYESRSEYQKALESYLEAIEIHKSTGNKKGVANTLNSLSFVYKGMGQYEKALEVLEEAKKLYENLGNKERLAGITFNIGLMTMEMDKYAEAIAYFRKAMTGLREGEEPKKFSSFYNNLANCYQKLVHTNAAYYDSALYYGQKNLTLKQQLKDQRGIANAHNGLAATYERASDYTHSYSHALAALKISDSLKFKSIKKNALDYLITAEIGLKKMDKLNDHFVSLTNLTEELNEESHSRTLSEMATKYETGKKEAENQRLLLVNRQQTQLSRILGGSGILLLTVLGLLAYFYRDKQQANVKLQEQKKQIEFNLREKEALLREIHHRVKNNLQVISSLLNMQSYYMDDPRMINAIAEGQNRVKAMALIHQKLYQTDHLSEIDFQEYTEQLISHLATAFGDSGRMVRSKVNGSALKLDIDTAIPLGLILNELITNSYKYAFNGMQEGNLKVDLTRDNLHYYHLRISDSGHGFPADFNEDKLNSLGLKLVRMLIEQLDGSLAITNDPGAHFYIRFKESKLSA
jgi:two-component sensor histidine kinase